MSKRIAVLMGGVSPERDVSLISGKEVVKALKAEGFNVIAIDAGYNLWEQLCKIRPDIIFNALHGVWGEDGRVQGVLDMFGKPYTHSGVLASALAMDKHRAKIILASAGINVPKGKLVKRADAAKSHILTPPYVLKPNAQGSSVGVYIIEDTNDKPPLDIAMNDKMGDMILAEEFAPGRELTVAVLNGKALCVTEILPADEYDYYDYEAKYAEGGSKHILPAKIPDMAARICMQWAETAHRILGCKGLTRSDFRFDDENLPKNAKKTDIVNKMVMLELNTQPGMTPKSLAPEQAEAMGMDFRQLCRWIVEDASWPR